MRLLILHWKGKQEIARLPAELPISHPARVGGLYFGENEELSFTLSFSETVPEGICCLLFCAEDGKSKELSGTVAAWRNGHYQFRVFAGEEDITSRARLSLRSRKGSSVSACAGEPPSFVL